jgi:hypothetical protein
LANGQKIIPLFGKWPKNYTTFWQMAKKLYHFLANGQKIIPLLKNGHVKDLAIWQIKCQRFAKCPNLYHIIWTIVNLSKFVKIVMRFGRFPIIFF